MRHNRKIIYLSGFLFSLPVALMSYINSSFLSSFVGENLVGLIYACGSVLSVLILLTTPYFFRKLGGYKFLLLVIALDSLSVLSLGFAKNSWSAIFAFIMIFSLNLVIFFSLDEILKIFTRNSITGKTRGLYLALCSLAWIIAQLAFGTILVSFSIREIYVAAFFVMIFFFWLSFFSLSRLPDPKYDNFKFIRYAKEFLRNTNLARAYKISFLLQFFYCWMVIYTPIYLSANLGFSWGEIGIIFAVMLLPFFILPFPLGRYADKIGERKMLILGFTMASISTFALFFIERHEIWIWALCLFLTRVGAATIETMSDVYFFKHIKPENEEFVGVYRSAMPLAYVLGPLLALIIFAIIPSFNFIYVILGTFMLYGISLGSTIPKKDL